MKRLAILIGISVIMSTVIKGEILPHYSVIDLCLLSDDILEAKFIERIDNDCYLATRTFGSKSEYYDTIRFERFFDLIDSTYINPRPFRKKIIKPTKIPIPSEPFQNLINIRSSNRLILFTTKAEDQSLSLPIFSGYRLIDSCFVYHPSQIINPGNYNFQKSEITAASLFSEIKQASKKVNYFKSLIEGKASYYRSIKFRIWRYRNAKDLLKEAKHNHNSGWGLIGNYFRRKNNEGIKPNQIGISELIKYFSDYRKHGI